jgi:glutamate dehydrogenase (NAD(P)+)
MLAVQPLATSSRCKTSRAEQEINQRLEAIMTKAYQAVQHKSQEQETKLRLGAYLLVVTRVAEATELYDAYS